jgi:hypothetical protein
MAVVPFDTLKLAQRLEAAGLPTGQAQAVAVALAETIDEAVVTREYLDLRLAEQTAGSRQDSPRWMESSPRSVDGSPRSKA